MSRHLTSRHLASPNLTLSNLTLSNLKSVFFLSVEEFSEVRETEASDGKHEEGVEQDEDHVEAPSLVPFQLQEDLEDWVNQKTLFPGTVRLG
jgi:hypothetical protein